MPYHRVGRGEWIGSIATKFGHKSWNIVWDHSKNAKLRKKRNPNLLVEGDYIFVPKVESKDESGSTEAKHIFKVSRAEDKLILRFVELEPYIRLFGPVRYRVEVGKNEVEGEIANEGEKVEVPIGLAIEEGSLWIEDVKYKVDIGGLDPIERLSGMQARINNLGWDVGSVDNKIGPKTRRGTRDFQGYYKIKVDGKIGEETRSKAKEVYGC